MILKIQLCLLLAVAWMNKASCKSISNVYIQRGAEALPPENYKYGTPGIAYTSPQIAQLSAAPVNSMVPVSSGYLSPCVAPCVYPSQTIASYAPVPSSSNLVSYQSSVPSLPTYQNEPGDNNYAYVVYNQNTGDKKSQREMSDGSTVRGEYSLLQPDGYVREVQYVADDITGFNAIVKNYLPVTETETKVKTTGETKPATPCPEAKSEPIKHIESVKETSSEEKHALSDEIVPESNHKAESDRKPQVNIPSKGEVFSKETHSTSTKEEHGMEISPKQKSTETLADASILVPYKDIMKCIESLLSKATTAQTESPLAYIILNKPC